MKDIVNFAKTNGFFFSTPMTYILKLARLISILLVLLSTLAAASNVPAENDKISQLQSFISLMEQSRASQKEALALLSELYSIEESILFPENDQLVIVMDQEYRAQVLLRRIDILIDGKLVTSHIFEMEDLEKFMDRGTVRLAARLVPPGTHLIEVDVISLNETPFKTEFKFKKSPNPQFIRLSLKGKTITLKDWTNG